MSTAFVFGPLSSMLRPEDRGRYRDREEVQARFAAAATILREQRGVEICFNDLLAKPSAELCARAHMNLTAALVICLQLGVVDRLRQLLPRPAWVVGCSLGDVARTISAGACTFETALHVVTRSLSEVEAADQIGSNVAVMTTPRHPFTTDDLAWFEGAGLTVSQLSDRLLNVAGLSAGLQQLRVIAQRRYWRIFHLLDFPLHSQHVARYSAQAQRLIRQVPFSAPAAGTRVYSSVLQREVVEPDDLRQEFLSSLVLPHHWKAAANDLVENHGVTRFVNIGPCRTLSRLLEEQGHGVVEADALFGCKAPAALTA